MSEQSLILIKPDGVQRALIGKVITRIENKGYQIKALKMLQATRQLLEQHYFEHVDKDYFPELVSYMTETAIIAIIIEGDDVIQGFRNIAGATSPSKASAGTIRGDFGRSWATGSIRNIVHSSDSPENAKREIKLWFSELEDNHV